MYVLAYVVASKPEFDARWELTKRCPSMQLRIYITVIHCDYQGLYEYLNVRPSSGLAEAADQVGNTFCREDLNRRAAELGMDPTLKYRANIVDFGDYSNDKI